MKDETFEYTKNYNSRLVTGGIFNHTAVLTFANGQYRATVEQRFLGLDVFDQLRMEGKIFGTVPSVPHGYKLSLPDSQTQFRKVSAGKSKIFLVGVTYTQRILSFSLIRIHLRWTLILLSCFIYTLAPFIAKLFISKSQHKPDCPELMFIIKNCTVYNQLSHNVWF